MMDREKILQAEHDLITDAYDWLNDNSKVDGFARIQYVLGAHDLALMLLAQLDETKGE